MTEQDVIEQDVKGQIINLVKKVYKTDDIALIDSTMRKLAVLRFSIAAMYGEAEEAYSKKFVELINKIDETTKKKMSAAEAEKRADADTGNNREKLKGLMDSMDEMLKVCKVSIRLKTGDWATATDADETQGKGGKDLVP